MIEVRKKHMDSSDLISVVVPVYKVEKYLPKCIDSILNQTYANLELILIDDGSPDDSGRICDRYAAKDERIRVIHQENKGLAEVRNIGIRQAKGDYLQFVDGDDWIESNTLERCISVLKQTGSDIVCFRSVASFLDGTEKTIWDCKYGLKVLSRSEALSCIFFPQYVDVISCNKLIKTGLLQGIEYPRGMLYEDMFTTYKIIAKAVKVSCIDDKLYHYLRNPESIGHYRFSERTYNLGKAAEECCEFGLNVLGTNRVSLLVGKWFWQIVVVNYMIKANKIDANYVNELREEINGEYIIKCSLLTQIRKLQMMLFKYNFEIYRIIYKKTYKL